MEYEVGDVVPCIVEKISGTVVFVNIISSGGEKTQGSIVMSEIAPGRIRNIREHVVPKKRIVCKILRVSQNGNIDLSLRRVTQKEKKEVLDQEKQEKSYKQILKSVLGEKTEETIKKILDPDEEAENLYEFFEKAKQNPKTLEKIISKKDSDKIIEILKTQKQKTSIIKKEFSLSTKEPNGINLIKKILSEAGDEREKDKNVEIKYISAGKYIIKKEAENPKSADNTIKEILKDLEEKSKKIGLDFSYKEK